MLTRRVRGARGMLAGRARVRRCEGGRRSDATRARCDARARHTPRCVATGARGPRGVLSRGRGGCVTRGVVTSRAVWWKWGTAWWRGTAWRSGAREEYTGRGGYGAGGAAHRDGRVRGGTGSCARDVGEGTGRRAMRERDARDEDGEGEDATAREI